MMKNGIEMPEFKMASIPWGFRPVHQKTPGTSGTEVAEEFPRVPVPLPGILGQGPQADRGEEPGRA